MIALLDHPADIRKRRKALCLASPEGMAFKMRNDRIQKLVHRSRLVFEGAIGLRLPDPSASEECLKIPQEFETLLVQRKRKRGSNLESCPQLAPQGERDAEASFAFRKPTDEP